MLFIAIRRYQMRHLTLRYAPRLFNLHQLRGFVRNVLRTYFKLLDQLPGSARIAEAVLDADGAGNHRQAVELAAAGTGRR